MKFAKVSERNILNLLEDLKSKKGEWTSTGDVLVLRMPGEYEEFQVIKIAERRYYDKDLNLIYYSKNDNYETTIS
jgi:ribosomal 50S subunit-recycling heat shock protein